MIDIPLTIIKRTGLQHSATMENHYGNILWWGWWIHIWFPTFQEYCSSLHCFLESTDEKCTQWGRKIKNMSNCTYHVHSISQIFSAGWWFYLVKRSICHAFDKHCKSIDKDLGILLINQEGNVGIRLAVKVSASIYIQLYDMKIVPTWNQLVCCKFKCQYGSQWNRRLVCVHTLVPLYTDSGRSDWVLPHCTCYSEQWLHWNEFQQWYSVDVEYV